MRYSMGQYAKAIIGAITAGLGTLYTADINGHISQHDWVAVAITTLVSFGAVFGISNSGTTTTAVKNPPQQ
jgi:hypothetical protein